MTKDNITKTVYAITAIVIAFSLIGSINYLLDSNFFNDQLTGMSTAKQGKPIKEVFEDRYDTRNLKIGDTFRFYIDSNGKKLLSYALTITDIQNEEHYYDEILLVTKAGTNLKDNNLATYEKNSRHVGDAIQIRGALLSNAEDASAFAIGKVEGETIKYQNNDLYGIDTLPNDPTYQPEKPSETPTEEQTTFSYNLIFIKPTDAKEGETSIYEWDLIEEGSHYETVDDLPEEYHTELDHTESEPDFISQSIVI